MDDLARELLAKETNRAKAVSSVPLGGWLIVLAVFLVISALVTVVEIVRLVTAAWPDSSAWAAHRVFEIATNIGFAIFFPVALVQLLRRRKRFVRFTATGLMTMIALLWLKVVWLLFLPDGAGALHRGWMQKAYVFAVCCVWIAYLQLSKRVRATLTS